MPTADDPEQLARRREVLDRTRAQLDALFAPTKFEAANDVASFAQALRKLEDLERAFTRLYEDDWLLKTGKAPPPLPIKDCQQGCRLIREAGERVGVRDMPPLPEAPVSLARYHLFRQRTAEAAERQVAQPLPQAALTFMPAAWFVKNTDIPPERLRQAARRKGSESHVRTKGAGRAIRYCVQDAQRLWEHDFAKTKKP